MREHPVPPEIIQRLTAFIFGESDGLVRTSGIIARSIATQQLPEFMESLLEKLRMN